MGRPEVDGLNAGYAALLLEQYLDNPAAVASEWRALFESAPETLLSVQPGLARLLDLRAGAGNGHPLAVAPPAQPAAPELIGGVAASMAEEFFGKFSRAVAGGVGGDRLEAASQAAGAAALSPRAIAGHIPLIDRCAWLLVGVGIGVIATLEFLGRL